MAGQYERAAQNTLKQLVEDAEQRLTAAEAENSAVRSVVPNPMFCNLYVIVCE